jgi:SAM-dependent methyltransferase
MSKEVSFWDERYRGNRIVWDAGGVPCDAAEFIRTTKPGRVLLPGCGSGYEVAAFVEAGWDAVGVELSPAAIEVARQKIGVHAGRIVCADFFSVLLPEPFDVVYERAFLCAVSPDLWEPYLACVHARLRPGGAFAGYFYYGRDEEPPPYPLTVELADRLLGGRFRREEDRAVADSVAVYADGERWQIWRKR